MAVQKPKDYGPKAATYLTVLGWLNLLGLNLGGPIWLWFAWNVRARSNGFRKAAAVLLGLHVLVAGLIPLKLLLTPGDPPKLRAFGDVLSIGPVIIVLSAVAFGAVFLIPMLWLLAPGTRAAFERRADRWLCVHCGYDLRASKDRCSECGTPITPKPDGIIACSDGCPLSFEFTVQVNSLTRPALLPRRGTPQRRLRLIARAERRATGVRRPASSWPGGRGYRDPCESSFVQAQLSSRDPSPSRLQAFLQFEKTGCRPHLICTPG